MRKIVKKERLRQWLGFLPDENGLKTPSPEELEAALRSVL